MSEQKKVSHDVLVDLVESIIEDSIDEPQFSTWEHALMGVEKIRDEYLAAHDREVKAEALREAARDIGPNHGAGYWLRHRAARVESEGDESNE